MIRLTRLNHSPLVLNSDLIEHIEITPDTVISLLSGQKMMVLESANEVVRRVVAFRRQIYNAALEVAPPFAPDECPEGGAKESD
jgi:flagellar protein FlbD